MQLISGLTHTLSIIAINDKDQSLGVLEVMAPQRTDLGGEEQNENELEEVLIVFSD